MLIALLIFVVTLIFVIWQPKGLGIGTTALLGAVVAFLTGVISLQDIPVVWDIVWNATFAFIAIILISLILDAAGFFEWIALHFARFGQGNGRRLFVYIVLLGALVAALFANDGAALIITPIVIAMLVSLGMNATTTLAFIMAAGFIADTASLPFIISNLVNIVTADFFSIGFVEYAQVMVPVTMVSIAMSLGVLYLMYRRDIPVTYQVGELAIPASVIKDKPTFQMGWLVIVGLLVGLFVLEPLGVPVSVIAWVGAVSLLISAYRNRIIPVKRIVKESPWQVVFFSLGMYLVVYGLRNAGLTEYLTAILSHLADQGIWVATLGTGMLAAGLSSVMNNMPTVLIGALAIDDVHTQALIKEAMIYANIIGCDLGPKITPIGSLATLLWLHVLATKDIKITWGYYFKVGIILTLPVLTVTLLALAGWLLVIN